MLEQQEIEDLLRCRLPRDRTERLLASLTPDHTDEKTFLQLMDALQERMHCRIEVENTFDCIGGGWMNPAHLDVDVAVALTAAAGGVKVAAAFWHAEPVAYANPAEQLRLVADVPMHLLPHLQAVAGVVFFHASDCYPDLKPFNETWQRLTYETGVDSVFRYMIPLLNPAQPRYRLIGVSHAEILPKIATYLAEYTRTRRAMIVRGEESQGISHAGKTHVYEITGMKIHKQVLQTTFGDAVGGYPEMAGPDEAAEVLERLIGGRDEHSVHFWRVCLQAGAAFYLTEKVSTVSEGMVRARQLLLDGEVAQTAARCRKALSSVHA